MYYLLKITKCKVIRKVVKQVNVNKTLYYFICDIIIYIILYPITFALYIFKHL